MIPDGMAKISQSIPEIPRFMYHQSQMRRALSILLVLFFSLGPLAATLQGDDDARLPACCRRHGAHHCAMTAQMAAMLVGAESGKPVLTAPSTCPAFPGSVAATAPAPQALAGSAVSLPALLAHPHSPAGGRSAARLSQIRTRAGRAPPQSSLS
jgi:hypothetical protein